MKTKVLCGSRFFTASCYIVLVLVLQACGKGTNIPSTAGNSYNFSISGDHYVGDTLRFQSTAPDNSIFGWSFGDGNISSQPAPYHVYYSIAHNAAGAIVSDTVTLTVNNDIYHQVVKTILLKPAVPKLSQTWVWTGGYFQKYGGNCCPALVDHALNDTTFDITRYDDYTITVWGNNLPFLADSNYFSNIHSTGKYNATTVIYTPDTLFFRQVTGDDTAGYITTYFHKF